MSGQPPVLDQYMEASSGRSPRAFRNQQPALRQPARQFDGYGPINPPPSLYNPNDPMARYDGRRADNRFGPVIPNNQMNGGPFAYDGNAGAHTWNAAAANAFAGNHQILPPPVGGAMAPIGSQTARLRSSRPRAGLPGPWLDQAPMPPPFPTMELSRSGSQGLRQNSHDDDELIPTAIVIKNIPFAVKKETIVQLMTEMNLPLPYAFNYHFDNGVFRGLAFANFTSPEETATVIAHLNHLELQGRKLRVEYKKMLPPHERERIEQDKRWRRGQLEEQHRTLPNSQLQNQPSMSSLASLPVPGNSPSPVSQHGSKPNIDLNDKQTLTFYTELIIFKNDPTRETLVMPPDLSPEYRRTIHTLAHSLNLQHASHGTGDQRQVHIMKLSHGTNVSPPHQGSSNIVLGPDGVRNRGLNRAATTDFGEARQQELSSAFNGLRGQSSVGLLGVLEPTTALGTSANLRSAKSFADLRSYTPSPAPSASSFPVAMQNNAARMAQLDSNPSPNTPIATPNSKLHHDDNQVTNSMGSLSLGTGIGGPSSPRRVRNMFSWESQQPYSATAPIGSNRTVVTRFEDGPSRQPRGPANDRSSGFRRQNGHHGRGSDELRNPEIIVE